MAAIRRAPVDIALVGGGGTLRRLPDATAKAVWRGKPMANFLPVVDVESHNPAMVLQGRVRLCRRGVRSGSRHIEHLLGLRRRLGSRRNKQQYTALLLHLG